MVHEEPRTPGMAVDFVHGMHVLVGRGMSFRLVRIVVNPPSFVLPVEVSLRIPRDDALQKDVAAHSLHDPQVRNVDFWCGCIDLRLSSNWTQKF